MVSWKMKGKGSRGRSKLRWLDNKRIDLDKTVIRNLRKEGTRGRLEKGYETKITTPAN